MKFSWWVFLTILLVEFLSFLSFFTPLAQTILFFLLCLTVLIVSLYDLKKGLIIALTELFFGGFGYLFALKIGGLNLSIRYGFFIVIFAATLWQIIKERRIEFFHSRFFSKYLWLGLFLFIGLASGYLRRYNPAVIFFDFNAFFFLGYLISFYQAFKNQKDLKEIWPVFWTALSWLAFKTIFVFCFFISGFSEIGSPFYKWLRDSGVGEITLLSQNLFRVFFQSQIYLVFALILLAAEKIWSAKFSSKARHVEFLVLGILYSAAIIISLSRSFWVGLFFCLALLFSASFLFLRKNLKEIIFSFLKILGIFFGGFLLILVLILAFHPTHNPFIYFGASSNRASISDAASLTRFEQLTPLWSAIKKHWIFGAGFGKTVSFISHDPRVLSQNPSGLHTTSAFEWGWLDLWLKIGLLGLLSYLMLLLTISKKYWQLIRYSVFNNKELANLSIKVGLSASLIALIIIHCFTPYLNHPLGLGWLILVSLIADNRS